MRGHELAAGLLSVRGGLGVSGTRVFVGLRNFGYVWDLEISTVFGLRLFYNTMLFTTLPPGGGRAGLFGGWSSLPLFFLDFVFFFFFFCGDSAFVLAGLGYDRYFSSLHRGREG